MIRCDQLITKSGMDVNMLMNVHDELLFEVSEKEPADLVVKEIVKAMEDHVTLSIPLEVDAKASKENWGDVKEWKDIKGQFKRHMRVTV
jgi:DNA polymerase-1